MNELQKRRMKKKHNNNKIIIIIIIVFVVLLSSGYSLTRMAMNITGHAQISDNNCEYNITPNFEITNSWKNNETSSYEVKITIVNNDQDDIEDWEIVIDGPSDLNVGWMNGDYTIDSGILTIHPLSYNRIISSNTTFEFQFNLTTVEEELGINSIHFNGCLIYGEGSSGAALTALDINPSTATIATGETLNLSLIKTPSYKTISPTWTSSDTSIATVDQSGTVTGISEGEVTISATAEGITATSTITVTRQVIELTSLTITPSSYRMTLGEIVPLQLTKTPAGADATITWSSSDPSVATVSQNGSVTAVSLGTTTITASSGNISATCQIRVAEEVSYDSVEFSFTKTYTWENNFHFKIEITNLSNESLVVSQFKLDIPDNSTISLWGGGYTLEANNVITATSWRLADPIPAGGTLEVTGSVSLPQGDSHENYPNVDIIDVVIE